MFSQYMKPMREILVMLLMAILFFSFAGKNEIEDCFITFKTPTDLKASVPDRLPVTSRKNRTLKTNNGDVEVTCVDGYRVLYNNAKEVPFVNLKVEMSEEKFYQEDRKNLIENLKYLNSVSVGMETEDLIELEFNGYRIYGLSRKSIESGSTLGIFIMFPGDGVTVYFYFNNVKPEFRNFSNVDDYKKQRDRFMEEYTGYLKSCEG